MPDKLEFNAMDTEFLLNHPILNEAFDKAREDMVEKIENGLPDRASQDGVMIGLQLLKTLKDNIYGHIEDAAMDKHKTEIEEY